MVDLPILILATGQRCGSTWLQRMLSTHPGVFVWGEHGGQLEPVLAAADAFAAWSNNRAGLANREFQKAGTSAFMANMAPPESVLREQVRTMIRGLFRRLPDGSTGPAALRWGFKEVRYGADFVRRFAQYFPDTRVVYLTRDPIAVLRSLEWWERTTGGFWKRERTEATLRSWREINASFLDAPDLAEVVLPVRYEELTGAREDALARICGFLGRTRDQLDNSVLDDVVHAPWPNGRQRRTLQPRSAIAEAYRDLLDDPDLARVAEQLGYSTSTVSIER
jgi:Sulfotransferase family